MKYPNALSGVKKVFIAQIFHLIGVIAMIAGASMLTAFTGNVIEAAYMNDPAAMSAMGIIGAISIVELAGLVIMIVGLILNIVGLGKARKDNEYFRYAFWFALFALIASIVAAFLATPYPDWADSIRAISTFFDIFVIDFAATGIMKFADELRRPDIFRKGNNLRFVVTIVLIISIALRIIGVRADAVTGILALVASIAEFVAFILYISLLAKTKRMLAEN